MWYYSCKCQVRYSGLCSDRAGQYFFGMHDYNWNFLIFNYYNLFMVSIMLQFFFGSVCMFTCLRVYVHVLAHMVSYSQIVVAFNSV